MDDLRTRAQLVDFDRAGGIGTVITRAEVMEAAAGAEFPATLLLDLDRSDARARVAVDWDQETLEQLLATTEDDEIGLWFDESELATAFDDVEGHGIREKAAVLAVAVVAAGASTSPAFARMASEPSGGVGAQATSASIGAQAGAAERALQAAQSDTSGIGASSVGSQAGTAERALMANESPSGILGVSSFETSTPDPAGDKTAVMAGTERGLVQDRHISQNLSSAEAAATSSSGGITLSAGELAGAVAGGALLIAAAGFGATRKRTPPAQPA